MKTIRLAARSGGRVGHPAPDERGRYGVEIEARDARGNRAAAQRKTVRVTR